MELNPNLDLAAFRRGRSHYILKEFPEALRDFRVVLCGQQRSRGQHQTYPHASRPSMASAHVPSCTTSASVKQ
jgi:hypothetical protein